MSDTSDNPTLEPQGEPVEESDVELVDLLEVEPDDEAAVDEEEYFDIDGEQLSKKEIKELKAREASMQSDYTKKTMALAEERKRFESEREYNKRLAQYREQALGQIDAGLLQINDEMKQLRDIDWSVVEQQYPDQYAELYAKASVKFNKLAEEADRREGVKQQQIQLRDSEEIQQLVRDVPELADPVKGFELAKKMQAYCDTYGIAVTDSKIGKLVATALNDADDAKKYRELVARSKSKSKPNASSEAPEPPKTVKSAASSSNALRDDLPVDEWLKRRNAQLKRR